MIFFLSSCYNNIEAEDTHNPVVKVKFEKDTVRVGDTIRIYNYSYSTCTGIVFNVGNQNQHSDGFPEDCKLMEKLSDFPVFDTTSLKNIYSVVAGSEYYVQPGTMRVKIYANTSWEYDIGCHRTSRSKTDTATFALTILPK